MQKFKVILYLGFFLILTSRLAALEERIDSISKSVNSTSISLPLQPIGVFRTGLPLNSATSLITNPATNSVNIPTATTPENTGTKPVKNSPDSSKIISVSNPAVLVVSPSKATFSIHPSGIVQVQISSTTILTPPLACNSSSSPNISTPAETCIRSAITSKDSIFSKSVTVPVATFSGIFLEIPDILSTGMTLKVELKFPEDVEKFNLSSDIFSGLPSQMFQIDINSNPKQVVQEYFAPEKTPKISTQTKSICSLENYFKEIPAWETASETPEETFLNFQETEEPLNPSELTKPLPAYSIPISVKTNMKETISEYFKFMSSSDFRVSILKATVAPSSLQKFQDFQESQSAIYISDSMLCFGQMPSKTFSIRKKTNTKKTISDYFQSSKKSGHDSSDFKKRSFESETEVFPQMPLATDSLETKCASETPGIDEKSDTLTYDPKVPDSVNSFIADWQKNSFGSQNLPDPANTDITDEDLAIMEKNFSEHFSGNSK
ncbi:MAG: hypothetical protein HQM08_17675 [Candidatus Riflebacteria bacterium]|nr:hypothetical protein [Candidatus Riflebacteria bacterium]